MPKEIQHSLAEVYFNTQQVTDISWKTSEGKHSLELVQPPQHPPLLYFQMISSLIFILESYS